MALILAALLGVFISLVGVWFITSPFNAVQAFGIDPSHMADIALAPGFGVRDVALGLIIIGFALARKQQAPRSLSPRWCPSAISSSPEKHLVTPLPSGI